jgi:hypothetical protein
LLQCSNLRNGTPNRDVTHATGNARSRPADAAPVDYAAALPAPIGRTARHFGLSPDPGAKKPDGTRRALAVAPGDQAETAAIAFAT